MRTSESSAAFEARITANRQWQAFQSRKDELKASGLSGRDSYWKAREEFTYSPPPPSTPSSNPLAITPTFLAADETMWASFEWACDHFDNIDIQRESAPSAEAWNLRTFMRECCTSPDDLLHRIFVLDPIEPASTEAQPLTGTPT